MENKELSAIILAGGKGTRMRSPLPKVVHPVAGRPMIERVIKACRSAQVNTLRLVVGHGQELVKKIVEPFNIGVFLQTQQLGTAHAVIAANPETLEGDVLILNGDHPLVEAEDIQQFVKIFREEKAALGVVTAKVKQPGDFGRIVRQKGELKAIVEAKEATAETLKINEINTGIYVVTADALKKYLPQIKNNNAKGEYYLTDLVALCFENHERVIAIQGNARVAVGVNSQVELAKATRKVFINKAKQLLEAGVILVDPARTYIEESVQIGPATVIYPGVYLRGQTQIGSICFVEPGCYIVDSVVGDSVVLRAGTYLESTRVANRSTLGPYARLRPGTEIGEEAHIGNFVEMKKVKFGAKSKAGHLTYLGDAEIGTEVNIGCGTITCNYAVDKKKYKTIIGDNVFVGSDTQFVAPVQVGEGAVIGSGSTITKDVPAKSLAVARGKQVNIDNWVARQPSKENAKKENLK